MAPVRLQVGWKVEGKPPMCVRNEGVGGGTLEQMSRNQSNRVSDKGSACCAPRRG